LKLNGSDPGRWLGYSDPLLGIFEHQDQGEAMCTGTLPCPAATDVFPSGELNGGFDGFAVGVGAVDELSPEPLSVATNEPPAAAVEELPACLEGFCVGGQAE
jgi:hypothetical protein